MNREQYIESVLGEKYFSPEKQEEVKAFAPSNIALCKYWGKRNEQLNLPNTSSLSISLTDVGTTTELRIIDAERDVIYLNDQLVPAESSMAKRTSAFIDLFRPISSWRCEINTVSDIPVAAGLASSASGFAALTKSLNELLGWNADLTSLSKIARLGSGSAARSFWDGFVIWHAGEQPGGDDCYAEPIQQTWPELCVGLLIANANEKPISSREAMQKTVATSAFYKQWPSIVEKDLQSLQKAITVTDFQSLGEVSEKNAIAMHATMLTASPAVCYWQPSTIADIQKVWSLRGEGMNLYFTQDAGPNIKLLFLEDDRARILAQWPECKIIKPFPHKDKA